MSYIFLDESGDMGFDFTKKKTSQYFIITCLFSANNRPLQKIIKRTIKSFSVKERLRHHGVLHAHKETDRTRRKILNELAQQNVSVISIYLNKKRVHTHLKDQKHILYNFVSNILIDRICTNNIIPTDSPIELIASRRETNKILTDNFKKYLQSQIKGNHTKVNIAVAVKTPSQEKGLQVADFACWAIFRNREHKDDTYYNMIKGVIVEESPLFP